jgi:AAT family amino acid transporter/D-serine/D-alanine/glycine transporter
MLIGVALNYLVPSERVFVWVTSVALVGTFWTWGIILVSHRNYRRAVSAGKVAAAPFRMPGAPYANWLVLAFLLAVSAGFWRDPDNRVALFVAPVWFGLLAVGYFLTQRPGKAAA